MLLLATPGPTNTLLWVAAATSGARRALPLVLAELSGYASAIALILLLLQPMLVALPWLRAALTCVVACYIALLALRLWKGPSTSEESPLVVTPGKVYLTTLLNPKAFVFALGILPVGDPAIVWFLLMLGGCILLAGSGWVLLGALAGVATNARHGRWLTRLSSVVLGGFAGLLLWSVVA